MITLAYIIAIFASTLSLIVIVIAVAGVESCKVYNLKSALISEGESGLMDTNNDVGISIVVSGFRGLANIEQLLSLNHIKYEIILLTDLRLDICADDLLEHYSMVAIDKTLSNELACGSIRTVYRSRQRRYHKLMVVDRQRTTLSMDYNCGVNVCTYEYVMAIDAWGRLHPNSLQHVVNEIFEQFDNRRVYAIGGFRAGTPPKNSVRIVDTLMRMVVLGAGMSQVSRIAVEAGFGHTAQLGRYAGTAIVFDREVLIDAGGYRSDFFPDTELYSRIRLSMKSRHTDASAVFIPEVIAYEDGPDQLSASSLPLTNASFIERVISRRVSTFFFMSCAVMLIIALFMRHYEVAEIICLSLFITYCVGVCIAALSLTVANKLLLNYFHYKSSLQLIPFMFLYPFFLLYCLLSPKKFY